MDIDIKKVNLIEEPMDEENYVYAICHCTFRYEGIRVSRPDHTTYIRFNCPCCGEKLGIVAKGKLDTKFLSVI